MDDIVKRIGMLSAPAGVLGQYSPSSAASDLMHTASFSCFHQSMICSQVPQAFFSLWDVALLLCAAGP
jgi:hypothetical protein